jgi:hypothetical protein
MIPLDLPDKGAQMPTLYAGCRTHGLIDGDVRPDFDILSKLTEQKIAVCYRCDTVYETKIRNLFLKS